MSLITAKHLDLGYEGKKIIKDISFQIESGDYLCIVGENGAGKSTLIKTILGLIPIVDGTICFGDGLSHTEIGYLPQQTQIQRDFPASVYEIVLSGRQSKLGFIPFYRVKDKAIALQNMKRMKIDNLMKTSYSILSGGQQQRVLLARALCATKRILLLDEPVSGLDPQATSDMYQLIQQLNHEGITIVMISHDIISATKYASKILHIGAQVFFGSTNDYLQSEIGQKFISTVEVGAV